MTEAAPDTMSFWQHLEELRARIVRSAYAFLGGTVLAWAFKEKILLFVTEPFVRAWPKTAKTPPALHFGAPADLFLAYVKLSLIGGFLLALPVIFYQIWAFIAPGLYAREKRFALPFVLSSTLLFAAGAYFGWRFVFPQAFTFFFELSELPKGAPLAVTPTVMIDDYLDFMFQALLAFGSVFEIPIVVFFLSLTGLLTHRHLIGFFRYFIVVAFVIAAVITPPDPMSQIMLAVPLIVLYALSIGLAYAVTRGRELPGKA